MLHEFLTESRDEILERSRLMLAGPQAPVPSPLELSEGLPLFLDQLIAILREKDGDRSAGHLEVADTAAVRGGDLQRMGLTVGQVVQDYGSICQSVTWIANARQVPITVAEFHIFNRCLDDAIAQAVTSYEHQRDRQAGGSVTEGVESMVHEMRNMVTTSMLTFDALKRGTIGVQGSTSGLLGNSLRRMSVLLDRTLAEIRLGAGAQTSERVSMVELFEEIELAAAREAKALDIRLAVDRGPGDVFVQVDRQAIVSAVANVVQNAFKFTRARGQVTIRAYTNGQRVLLDVEDECGGLPPGDAEELFRRFEQRASDKSGGGVGLSLSRKGVQASGGEIRVRDRPGQGCVFTIDLPSAPPAAT